MTITSATIATRLIRLQLGQETTWGSSVTATSILNGLVGLPKITPLVKDIVFDEQRGSLVPSYSASQVVTGGTFDLAGVVTFEDILYILGGAYGLPTPTGSYIWTFAIPTTSTFTPVVYTMELGNLGSSTATKLTGAMIQQWAINGEQQKEMSFTAKGFGSAVSYSVSPTGSLSYRTTEVALTPEVAFAMDPAGTAAGTTAYSGQLVSFAISGDSGLAPYYAAGSKAPLGFTYLKQQLGLKVSLIYSSALQTALGNNLLAGKTAVIQIKATSGSKIIEFDFSGALKADPVYYEDSQGAQMVSMDMDAVYDATDAYYTKIVVTNTVASLA